jgi:putative adenylate-forming enzyme
MTAFQDHVDEVTEAYPAGTSVHEADQRFARVDGQAAAFASRAGNLAGAVRHYRNLIRIGTPRDELLAFQRRRLVETARHAAAASPLYRELYAGVELADDLDVRALPVVTKAMLMERFDEWVTDPRLRLREIESHLAQARGDEPYLHEYRCLPTGGTTGQKGIFVYDRQEWRQVLAVILRWCELTDLHPRLGRRVRFARIMSTSPLHVSGRFGLSFDLGLHAVRQLDARTPLGDLVTALNHHQPEHLWGYPSLVSLLAIEQLEGHLRIAPQAVATTGEVRTEQMARNIRDAWGVEPFNLYATTEGLFGSECEHHQGIHLFEDLGLVEVVDDDNQPLTEGVSGAKLLFTSFIKRTQPLLRYELSDMVALSTAPCACGRPLARIVSLQGRNDDVLHLTAADGQSVVVHPLTLQTPIEALPELRQYKVVHDHDGVHVLVTLRDGVDAEQASQHLEATLRAALLAAGVSDPSLDVTILSELPRDQRHSAKFKLIESRPSPIP